MAVLFSRDVINLTLLAYPSDIRLMMYRNLLIDIGETLHIENRGKRQKNPDGTTL